MNKNQLFIRSVFYSFQLIYASSGLLVVLYCLLSLISISIPIANTFISKMMIEKLESNQLQYKELFIILAVYVSLLLLLNAVNSLREIINSDMIQRAELEFKYRMQDKLQALPMSFIDSASGKDCIEYVRRAEKTVIYLPYRVIRVLSLIYSFTVSFVTVFPFSTLFSLLFLFLTIPGIIFDSVFDRKTDDFRRKTAPDVRKFCYYRWMLICKIRFDSQYCFSNHFNHSAHLVLPKYWCEKVK